MPVNALTQDLRERLSPAEHELRTPLFFRANSDEGKKQLSEFLTQHPDCTILDSLESQLHDLIKLENPGRPVKSEEYAGLISERLNGKAMEEYGVWVYYPWRNKLIHLLDEEEFIRVRTIRNAHKITFEEQAILRTKKVGVVGLSVGQSVSLALAMERIAGEIRIADFDTLELSNLNRIRSGVHNLGIKKTTLVAREIAEIDPYIRVVCFDEGITSDNINSFATENGKLDLIAEECDSVVMKIGVREFAREHGIPVVMDTSDRGMIDIERYDLEKDRPILHGLLPENYRELLTGMDGIKQLTMRLIEVEKGSERGVYSLMQIGKSITNWPQLGTDVIFGGAVLAKLIAQILLGNNVPSVRTRLDIVEHYTSKTP